jgi:hypothetical protein
VGQVRSSLTIFRILCCESHKDGTLANFLWAAMEGIRNVGFSILDLGPLCVVHGVDHSSKSIRVRVEINY